MESRAIRSKWTVDGADAFGGDAPDLGGAILFDRMALHGDLFSFPLPELLQWLDSSRKTGTLQLSWEAGDRKLFLLSGQVVAMAAQGLRERLAVMCGLAQVAPGDQVLAALRA